MKLQVIEENGAPRFAVLPYSERFSKELEGFDSLEDFLDYVHALEVKAQTTKWYSLEDVKKQLLDAE